MLHWLDEHRTRDTSPSVVVHGDAGHGNFMVVDDRITGLVDWEMPDDSEYSDYPRLGVEGKKKIKDWEKWTKDSPYPAVLRPVTLGQEGRHAHALGTHPTLAGGAPR